LRESKKKLFGVESIQELLGEDVTRGVKNSFKKTKRV